MTVEELIAKLEGMPPNWEVLSASDAESNSFNQVEMVEIDHDIELYHGRLVIDHAVVIWP